MISHKILRYVHINNFLWQSSNKALLAKLRKKTGYTFSNCKKALELHENDLQKAETWLKEQAQALGWSQAAKVQGRTTSQGLIAVVVDNNHGALVEINCETDFVARNKYFQNLTETVANAVLKYSASINSDEPVTRIPLDSETLKALPASDGKSLADHSALTIGSVGENLGIRRALCLSVQSGIFLSGCTHPAPTTPHSVFFGRYGALVAYKIASKHKTLGIQLCQHIIGMNPDKVGNPENDQPNPVSDDETTMIFQEFLLDPSVSVQQFLVGAQAEILDYARFEMGESLERPQKLDSVEICG
ncbi:elongation factor Ts, mitochondrial [Orussus abietinus]|uniref:elongation factor Ts, mitochondrial n=1 Tax=Orussus abietinus TaxID=222816 RepID=UPI00062540D3|nr:elongation factor Ts, mitochondrial [Orussus abietinus]XP_012285739.1 elongation factor Ts, mitochondrial [Orussus abietinus]